MTIVNVHRWCFRAQKEIDPCPGGVWDALSFPTDLWLPSKIPGPRPAVVGAASAEEVATEKPRRFLKMVQLMVVLIGKMMINHETSMVDWWVFHILTFLREYDNVFYAQHVSECLKMAPTGQKYHGGYPGDSPMEWGVYNLLLDIRNLVLVIHPMKKWVNKMVIWWITYLKWVQTIGSPWKKGPISGMRTWDPWLVKVPWPISGWFRKFHRPLKNRKKGWVRIGYPKKKMIHTRNWLGRYIYIYVYTHSISPLDPRFNPFPLPAFLVDPMIHPKPIEQWGPRGRPRSFVAACSSTFFCALKTWKGCIPVISPWYEYNYLVY